MLYSLYEAQRAALTGWRTAAGLTKSMLQLAPQAWTDSPAGRMQTAWCEMVINARITHTRPAFRIQDAREVVAASTPFAKLLHFEKGTDEPGPRVMIVAALSGHFSTLMRHTVQTMLADHDVYVIEWNNARDIPVADGRFGLDEYIDHVVDFLEDLGPDTHVVAVCQPGPAVLAATAILAERKSVAQPRSLTLMAAPMDTSVSPNSINHMAHETPLSFFADWVVMPVPAGRPGFGRKVYPGFVQLSSFMSMNPGRHMAQHANLFWALVKGNTAEAQAIREFYDEYFAVLDMDADFYLDTIDAVFQRNLLAKGQLDWHGRRVHPGAIESTAILTVEGEQDDICGAGQTHAAHDLLPGVEQRRKHRYTAEGVGHYGIFSGHRWEEQTYPVVRDFIAANA